MVACDSALTTAIASAYAKARDHRPELSVREEVFRELVVDKLPAGASPDQLDSLPLDELYLVCACLDGDTKALRDFERSHFVYVVPALRRMKLDQATVDEVIQLVREKLFVADATGAVPLRKYAAKGDLRTFVRVVATRTAVSLLRKRRPEACGHDDDALFEVASSDDTPQMQYLKNRHRADFKAAFEEAVARLTAEERNLLRLSFIDKLSVDALGTLQGVHRATAARRLARAKERVGELTRDILRAQLDLESGEFTSIVRLIQSQLDVSVRRILETEPDE